MQNNPIGILDSGVGGISIWKALTQLLPQESTIYIADSKNCPYGVKTTDTILRLSSKLVDFLLKKDIKMIIVACNTISVLCLEELRAKYKNVPIIGIVPVIKTAVSVSKNKHIGVFSTTATAKSEYQKKLIEKFANGCKVISVGTDSLVPFVERGEIHSSTIEAVLVTELVPFVKAKVDTIVLGCSHFPFLRESIQRIMPRVTLLDSSAAVARHAHNVLLKEKLLSTHSQPSCEFYTTGQNKNTFFELLGGTIAENTITHVDI